MERILFLIAVVIIVCVAFQRISDKVGIPGLFVFIMLGMLFGSDGIFKLAFDNYDFANQICTVALIFIMFYGGAGTKWSQAKPVAVKAIVLSSVGTILTAGFVGLFCYFVLHFKMLESFLVGAVICSTDAASVFSILRSKKMNLKYSTASLLEVESGSNDPFSYMMTIVVLSLMKGGKVSVGSIAGLLISQVVIGLICGFVIAYVTRQLLIRWNLKESGLDTTFMVAVALLSYMIPTMLNGNGYLSVYITGILLGNSDIPNKKAIIHFFNDLTGLMQMLLFFLLGLLAFPSYLPGIMGAALLIALFLTFVARPAAVALTLLPFKCKLNQQLFVAWAGMRGAASIAFAIMATTDPAYLQNDIFHIVFFIVLFSILIQGTLLPAVAKKLNMIDENGDVMKTFNDYADELPLQFIQFTVSADHEWQDKTVAEISLPPESMLVLIIREGKKIVPKGDTVLYLGDRVILSGREPGKVTDVELYERGIEENDDWANLTLAEIPNKNHLVILIRRGDSVIIPSGDTKLNFGDVLVINKF